MNVQTNNMWVIFVRTRDSFKMDCRRTRLFNFWRPDLLQKGPSVSEGLQGHFFVLTERIACRWYKGDETSQKQDETGNERPASHDSMRATEPQRDYRWSLQREKTMTDDEESDDFGSPMWTLCASSLLSGGIFWY